MIFPNDKEVKVILSKAVVFDNVIDEESIYFFDERDTVFNPLKYDDLNSLLIEEKEKTEKTAIDSGLLKEAENNVKILFDSYFRAFGYEKITVEFE